MLYHGSAYLTKKVHPGYYHTKKKITWDEFENNTFLYSTTNKTQAVILGFFSGMEKKYGSVSSHQKENDLKIFFDKVIPEVKSFNVYLYYFESSDIWISNKNPNNNLSTEFKTKQSVLPLITIKLDILPWLEENGFKVEFLIKE